MNRPNTEAQGNDPIDISRGFLLLRPFSSFPQGQKCLFECVAYRAVRLGQQQFLIGVLKIGP